MSLRPTTDAEREEAVNLLHSMAHSPSTPNWVKRMMDEIWHRDPVDVANVLSTLAPMFEATVMILDTAAEAGDRPGYDAPYECDACEAPIYHRDADGLLTCGACAQVQS